MNYANFGLLKNNTEAVAEAIKRYPLKVESIDFTNNGLRNNECIKLVAAMEPHFDSLRAICLSNNKIGWEGG
jgi:hypothetical protein